MYSIFTCILIIIAGKLGKGAEERQTVSCFLGCPLKVEKIK
jgi:hypothetical protein